MSATRTKEIFATVAASRIDRQAVRPSMTVSTASLDREGDRVLPEGGDFKSFLRNPVLCWAHSREGIPIGSVTQVSADSTGVRIQWAWLENDPFADRVKNAWEQGIVRAASIGFISKRSTRNQDGGVDHLAWELLEVSLCPVPANPSAVRTLKSLGLWNDAGSQEDGMLDWDSINRTAEPEVDVTAQEVLQVLHAFTPALREGVRAGIRAQAQLAARAAICRLTGRLD